MSFLTRSQRDELRTAVLAELATAHLVALSAEMLARRIQRSRLLRFEPDLGDIEGEIEALHAKGLVQTVTQPVELTPYFQATAAGVVAHGQSGR